MPYIFNEDKTKNYTSIQTFTASGTPTYYNNSYSVIMSTVMSGSTTFSTSEESDNWILNHVLAVLKVKVSRSDEYSNTEPPISSFGVETRQIGQPGHNLHYAPVAFVIAKPVDAANSYTMTMAVKMM